jgi:hypothetical protein
VLLRARAPESPVQTVRTDFPYTAYRWPSYVACTPLAESEHPAARRAVTSPSPDGISRRPPRLPTLGDSKQSFAGFSCFFKGVVGPFGHALTLTPVPDATKAEPLPSRGVLLHRDQRYYEPLGLPSGTVAFRLRLIATAFARRGPPARASPVPHQTFTTCPLPYPGSVLRATGSHAQSVAFAAT